MKCLYIFIFILYSQLSLGQDVKKGATSVSNTDSLKVAELLTLGDQETDTLIKADYYRQALFLSEQLQFEYGVFKSYHKSAIWKRKQYNADSSIVWLKKGINEFPESSSFHQYLLIYLSDEFKKQSIPDSAIYYCNKEVKLAIKYKNKRMVINGYKALGNIYLQIYKHDKAFLYYAKGDSVCKTEDVFNISKTHAEVYNYMGYAVRPTHGYEKALEYYLKAKDIYEKIDNEAGKQELNTAIAQAYISMNKYEVALLLLNESIAFQKDTPSQSSYSYAIIVRGFLLSKMNKLKEAEKDYKLYYELALQSKNKTYQRWGLSYLGDFYVEDKQFDKAISYYTEAKQLCKEEGDIGTEIMLTSGLINIYTQTKNFNKTVETYEEYIALLKLKEEKNIDKQTFALETKYQAKQKEQEISLLKTQNALVAQEKKNQRSLLLTAIGFTSIIGLFFFFLFKNRQKTTKKLKELDQVKSDFFTNISHELRTPLTLISGPVQNQLNNEELTTDDRINLEMIKRNADRLTELVDQLLDISKLETGSLNLAISRGNIIAFIGTLLDGFSFLSIQKQIDLTINSKNTTEDFWFDMDVLEKILVNLLSNAIKYTPETGNIFVDYFVSDEQLTFSVKNSGSGLSEEEMDKIFDRFYQINETKQGVGIGLALTKELVNLHKGSINVDSIPGEWTRFKLNLPIGKSVYTTNELTTESYSAPLKNKISKPSIESINEIDENAHPDEEKPLLLIVDDNDDVRTYISGLFSDTFNLLQAENGSIGIEMAIQHIPDIIICGIMMPITNGITLCNTLKEDELTSHIPIILLTAKVGQEHELEGIKTGADDYITKPFRADLLRLKIENIIANRKKLQERYQQEVVLRPQNIAVISTEKQFLEKIKIALDDQLVEPDFGVNDLSNEVGVSRMQLHRKLKAITGLSASEFIRTQRLQLAANLLMNSDLNISEIGYSTGFNNHAYFSKCFKEMYKCTPSEYANKE